MSSTARKTIDTDIITLRKVYMRGDSNATVPSSFMLMSDGGGGAYWRGASFPRGNTLVVDAVYGNDLIASVGGSPWLTVGAAVAAVGTGQTIWILPGTYTLTTGLIIPAGTSIRGLSLQTTTIQMINVTADTTLITMGENSRIEDVSLKLTSSGHYTLKGIVFGGTTTATAKLRTAVVTVDNSAASSTGTSTIYGVECSGTGALSSASFSFNSLKGSTINILSNGLGNKRGVIVTNTNVVTTRDLNIYIAQPRTTSSTGSYVGVETADAANTGSIQLRATTIGTVAPTGIQAYTASDILQTNPATVTDPTFLASPGIQIGPGTDLITKTAGGKGFSTFVYPTSIYYGLKGVVTSGDNNAYLWPGTQAIANNTFPDDTLPAAYYRIQQPSLLAGLSVAVSVAPGSGKDLTFLVKYTPVGGSITDTIFTTTISGTSTSSSFYNGSLRLGTGDKLHLFMTYTSASVAADITAQIDLF